MTSVFPGALDSLATDKANATASATDHPDHHNELAAAVNAIEDALKDGTAAPQIVVAAANSPAFMKLFTPYVCVGAVGNAVDHLMIQSAIDALPATGGKVLLCQGDYYTAVKLTVTDPDVDMQGQGFATAIHGANITGANVINSAGNVISMEGAADGCRVLDLRVDCMGTSQHGIVFNAVDYCQVRGCWVEDTVAANGAGIKAMGDGLGTPCRYIDFSGNFLSDCCSSITADFEVQFGSIANNVIERAKGDIGSGISAGDLSAATGAQWITVTGNVISHTHHGIVFQDANDCAITGNVVYSEAGGDRAIGIGACDRMVVTGNVCVGLAAGGDQAMILSAATRCLVVGNRFYNWTTGILGDANTLNNTVTNNYFETVTTPINGVTLANGNVVRQNTGFVTEASGTAIVLNGATTVVVTHGLGLTPALKDVAVTATNNLGNAVQFWISTPTSTQFTINTDSDPGATTATFVWQAAVY